MRSERYLGGLIDSRSGHLHPLKYTQGLARAAEQAGARIFEQTPALRFAEGAEVTVRTERGTRALPAPGALRERIYRRARAAPRAAHSRRRALTSSRRVRMDAARARALLPSDAAVADIELDPGLLPAVGGPAACCSAGA